MICIYRTYGKVHLDISWVTISRDKKLGQLLEKVMGNILKKNSEKCSELRTSSRSIYQNLNMKLLQT